MNYLMRVCTTDSDGVTHKEYQIIQADSDEQADNLARNFSEKIIQIEHYSTKKHGYTYIGKYQECYAYSCGKINDNS